MAARGGWSTWADVRAALQARWDRGDLLRSRLVGTPVAPVSLPIRGPTSREVAERFGDVQDWVGRWRAGQLGNARVETRSVGGRLIGANHVPARVVVDAETDLWSVLGVSDDVRRFDELVTTAAAEMPAVLGWVHARPHDALGLSEQWPRLLGVIRWVAEFGGPGTYLRQIDVPGVDTKFVETHASVLSALLTRVLPADRVDSSVPAANLARRFGLRGKQELIRFRPSDGPYREVGLRSDDLAVHPFAADRVLVVENEVSYLAVPIPPGTAAVYGGGYAVSRLAALPWLAQRDVVYWGDLDTHGFRALDRLRRFVPDARSMLMNDETLLAHRDHWGQEPTPVTDHLPLLTRAETGTYLALVHGDYGNRVRLEQERIRFGAVERAIARVWG